MDLTRRALLIGLRTLADELEAGRLDPAEVLGAIAPATPSTLSAQPPVAARRSRPRRQAKAGARPASRPAPTPPAQETAHLSAEDYLDKLKGEATPAQELLGKLVAAYGSLAAVSEQFGFTPPVLGRWARGKPCSPASLERLRQALAGKKAGAPFRGGDAA